MKKFIALLISASVIAAPVAFAADETPATTDTTAQQMTNTKDAATTAAKPAKHRGHRCASKHHQKATPAKKADTTADAAAPVTPAT